MCMIHLPNMNDEVQALASQHDTTSCADTWIAVMMGEVPDKTKRRGVRFVVTTVSSLKISEVSNENGSGLAGVVVYPCSPQHSHRLVPMNVADVPCVAPLLEGIVSPRAHIPAPNVDVMGYRSLAVPPSVDVPKLVVNESSDGSVLLILAVGEVFTQESVEKRAAMGPAMCDVLLAGLAEAGLDPKRVFGDKHDANCAESTWGIVGWLLDTLQVRMDIVMCVPAVGSTSSRFVLGCVTEQNKPVWFPGLVHGKEEETEVDGNFFVVSNGPYTLDLGGTHVPLQSAADFLEKDEDGVIDFLQTQFQHKCCTAVLEKMNESVAKLGVVMSPGSLHVTNLDTNCLPATAEASVHTVCARPRKVDGVQKRQRVD